MRSFTQSQNRSHGLTGSHGGVLYHNPFFGSVSRSHALPRSVRPSDPKGGTGKLEVACGAGRRGDEMTNKSRVAELLGLIMEAIVNAGDERTTAILEDLTDRGGTIWLAAAPPVYGLGQQYVIQVDVSPDSVGLSIVRRDAAGEKGPDTQPSLAEWHLRYDEREAEAMKTMGGGDGA